MTEDLARCIEALDDKQAIFQIKILLQAAADGTPAFAAMSEAAIARQIETIGVEPETLAQAAALVEQASIDPLPAREAGAAARELLRVFAAAPGGAEILETALSKKDVSADFGFITIPLVFTFLWLAVAGDFDLQIGGFRYRKKGLSSDQQGKLLKPVLPTAVKAIIKSATAPVGDAGSGIG
jgi:hypothetical protein